MNALKMKADYNGLVLNFDGSIRRYRNHQGFRIHFALRVTLGQCDFKLCNAIKVRNQHNKNHENKSNVDQGRKIDIGCHPLPGFKFHHGINPLTLRPRKERVESHCSPVNAIRQFDLQDNCAPQAPAPPQSNLPQW